jgi:hypothetical protein
MLENLTFRQAEQSDIDFIVEAIIEAEKSGSQMITSCNIFSLTGEEFRKILKDVLAQNIENYDYYLSGYLIGEIDGEYAGTVGSWVEGADGTPSGMLKASSLFPYLDKEKMRTASQNNRIIKGLGLPREEGTLQLEHGYTREKFRRQGVFTTMIKENIKSNLQKNGSFKKVQGILFKANYKSFNAHLKAGYEVVLERTVDDPEILKIFPYNTKVLMELNEEKISKL